MTLEELENRIKTLEKLENRVMALEKLENRVRASEDLEEIEKLQRTYMSYWDNMELDKIPGLFAENGTAEVRKSGIRRGKKEIAEFYVRKGPYTRNRDGHLCGQQIIHVNGNEAEGHWVVYIFFLGLFVQWVQGRNDCKYIKVNGEWKISELKFNRIAASHPALLGYGKAASTGKIEDDQ